MAQVAPSAVSSARTIARLWREGPARTMTAPLYLVEREGRWVPVTRREAAERVDAISNGLLALGVRKGDAFAIMARTTLEWALFDFALAQIGAVGVAVYPTSSERDAAYVVGHSDAVGILVETVEQRALAERLAADLPRLEHVLAFADLPALEDRGRELAVTRPDALEDASATVSEDDLFTLIYTSGTTGPPKGCMILHRQFSEMVQAAIASGTYEDDDVSLLYLPLAHTYGRLVHLCAPVIPFTLALLPDPLRVPEALVAVRPTLFPSVPRVYEKIHAAVLSGIARSRGPRRALASWALGVGRRAAAIRSRREPLPLPLRLQLRLADVLLFSKIRRRFGGRLRVCGSGGAPLAPEIAELFDALGILILEGYGLSECTTACTVNRRDDYRFGTVGKPMPGVELRIADDGEVLLRSPTVFAGYFKDEEATRAVLTDDGWLRTGDIGSIDDDGFLTITDRKKDILVTAGGKNVAPQNLENELKSSPFVSQALVLGDRRPYVAALVTVDQAEVEQAGGDARALVQAVVDDVNRDRSRYEQIKRFEILPRDFSVEEGELTPTLKLRRRVCEQHFAEAIERLYAP